MGAELADVPHHHPGASDSDEDEATDLNGRILHLIERGKREDAILLYREALGCDTKTAEAAIEEVAKNIEFAEARSAVPARGRTGVRRTGWFSGWVIAMKSLIGLE